MTRSFGVPDREALLGALRMRPSVPILLLLNRRIRKFDADAIDRRAMAGEATRLLLSGTVEIVKRKVGAEVDAAEPGEVTRLAVHKCGASIGEMSMLDGEPRYASCIALTDVEVAVLARSGVARLIDTQPGVGAKLLVKITQLLAQRLRNTSNQVIRLLKAK